MANRFASVRTAVGLTIYDILPKEWVGRASQCSDFRINGCQAKELAPCKTLASRAAFFFLWIDVASSGQLRHAIIANGARAG